MSEIDSIKTTNRLMTLVWIERCLGIGLSIYVIRAILKPLPPLQLLSLFMGILAVFIFVRGWSSFSTHQILKHLIPAILSIVIFGYIALIHEDLVIREGTVYTLDIVFAFIAILLILEATRRTAGWPLVIVAIVFLSYAVWGQYMPNYIGGHGGFSLRRIVTFMYLTSNGIFGIALDVVLHYVYVFVIFGALLKESGVLSFIIDFFSSLLGRFRGGPALISTVTSAIAGTISGSAMANVMITGVISIPLMKRTGFKPDMAGAVEAAASTGGQIMPPVMGAAAFMIMVFLGISYVEVMKAALIPAILYFSGIAAAVIFYSYRKRVGALSANERLPLRKILKRPLGGLIFVIGFSVLITFMVMRYSPMVATMYAMASVILLSWLGKDKIGPRKAARVLSDSSQSFASLGAACACVGIIIGAILLTGIGIRLANIILYISGGNLIITLLLTMVFSIILGMGLPTTIAYVLLAIVIVPSIISLGVLPLAAHLFIFYYGMLSMLTPPVALAAYSASSISGSSITQTSIRAFILALPAYFIPFSFILNPTLLMNGAPLLIIANFLIAIVGVIIIACTLNSDVRSLKQGFVLGPIFIIGALLLLGYPLKIAGLILAIPAIWWLIRNIRIQARSFDKINEQNQLK